ncbi:MULTISPECIES: hypothetical protein [Mycolicibacter]|uniref:Uncharacterized protein n=2 Tax=Mycolicibacter TaxID=1073531 RepID=A0ABU5XM87_9MYCO|nr:MULTISPECIES: hypothetical protein [unclassified Mycolicibacter]MEB3023390.1 hypothetical protein [Mycolicibacter sp. MYC098]MEB3033732.1 hypothetical protein [Mycolicibacter sp. MYC340]
MAEKSPLGFTQVVVAAPDSSSLTADGVLAAFNVAARDRGIEITAAGSDELDAARDVILAEAVAAAGGGQYRIVGDELWVTVPGVELAQFLP